MTRHSIHPARSPVFIRPPFAASISAKLRFPASQISRSINAIRASGLNSPAASCVTTNPVGTRRRLDNNPPPQPPGALGPAYPGIPSAAPATRGFLRPPKRPSNDTRRLSQYNTTTPLLPGYRNLAHLACRKDEGIGANPDSASSASAKEGTDERQQYLSLPSFDVVTSALNFDTPDCHVTGSCDLYTTKAAGSDKKLYKNIQQSLESQHAALVKFGASLSPPQRDSMAASLNLSRSSPFGSLDEVSNRRTFAYLIATLNASHPDYDFSLVLRPADFKRERVLRRVMTHIDSTLSSVRPNAAFLDTAAPRSSPNKSSFNTAVSAAPAWGPQMWAMIDKEMMLKDCTVFSYQPADDPFDEEEGAIWALHYFFFNKALKRVCYLYVRGVPVMSHSPRLPPHSSLSRRSALGGLADEDDDDDDLDDLGARKRARYWLGDKYAERLATSDDEMDDGLVWNRNADGDVNYQYDDDYDEDDDFDEPHAAGEYEDDVQNRRNSVRGVSEDIASRMEIDV